jgi:hypothetical protein
MPWFPVGPNFVFAPAPGWPGEYNTVRADIRLLAADRGVPHRKT